MKIVVIDGQGGRMGQLLVEKIRSEQLPCEIIAIGTNAIATAAMLKAGADAGATGENPALVACRTAGVIIGPIGILAADSMMGEVTPAMATAIAQTNVPKLLLPVNHCNNIVIGVKDLTLSKLVAEAVDTLRTLLV